MLAIENAGRVRGYVGAEALIGAVGQVVAESQPDPAVLAADAKDDQAVGRVKAEQVRNYSQDPVSRANLDFASVSALTRVA
jgi:hypothetical protein